MASELKPCPFCGSTNLDCGFMTGTLKGFDYVVCEDCGGEIHALHMSRGVINATDLWNRRAADDGHKAALYSLVNLVGATTMCNRCILSSYCYSSDEEIKCKDKFLAWAIGEDRE